MKQTLTTLAILTLVLSATTNAAAAPKHDPGTEINNPTYTCDGQNEITVTMSVIAGDNVDQLRFEIIRWEDVSSTLPEFFPPRFERVELWTVDFPDGGAIPATYKMSTSDPTTWMHHGWTPADYTDVSDVFTVNISVSPTKKSGSQPLWSDWVIDCSLGSNQMQRLDGDGNPYDFQDFSY